MNKPVRVLIVDDSAVIRQLLSMLLAEDPEIEVVGTAGDPLIARERIKELNPDVVTLDVEMPNMDGVTFLRKIMSLRPMPVVMISTLTQAGADTTLQALEIGAVDFIAKPTHDVAAAMAAISNELQSKVKAAARARVGGRSAPSAKVKPARREWSGSSDRIIAIGASTGGVEALKTVLMAMPAVCPPILITQHMPPRFTTAFAERLNRECPMTVSEAVHNEPAEPNHAYIAPGAFHLELARVGGFYRISLNEELAVSGHRPSVDVLFRSVARVAGKSAVGAILTGMGKDGAEGMLDMRKAGAITLGQDEASSLIYGMPRAAFERGAVAHQHSLSHMADAIMDACDGSGKAHADGAPARAVRGR
jgi:two-component system chemotaxis response regulator CheB